MELVVRPYEDADWAALCRVHDAARVSELEQSVGMEAFLSLEEAYEEEGLFDDSVFVAEVDGAVQGFIAASRSEITWLYAHPDHQRRGIGSALVAHVLDGAEDLVELEVLDGNAARCFYERLGFTHQSTTTGKLAGNERFVATGHTLVWRRPSAPA